MAWCYRTQVLFGLRALTTKYGTLLTLDETHTISTARGGWAKTNQVTPDFLVVGKPIAGGLPAAATALARQWQPE